MPGIQIDGNTGDIAVKNGTIAIEDNTLQCVEEILKSNRGEYKEFPLVGGECVKLLHGSSSRFWANRVKSMCEAMGVAVRCIDSNNLGEITIGL